MSWLIQTLLLKKENLKSEGDIESDEYNDLLLIEKAIVELSEKGLLSKDDLVVLGYNYEFIVPVEKMSRSEKLSYYRRLDALSDRIAYYMGGYFTDEGYLEYMRKKYKLSEEQMNMLRSYIVSKFKFQNMRKPINE